MTKHVPSFAIDDIREERRQVVNVRLHPQHFIVLTQVRKTYTINQDMLQSFYASGQIAAGLVAALHPKEARIYVDTINVIFGSNHKLSDLMPVVLDGETFYLIIFAGHQRHFHCVEANRLIEVQEREPTEHFDGRYRAELHFAITAKEAIELQFNENRYSAPPLHEEAEAAWRVYRYQRIAEPELTPGQFAKRIGRTTDWFRNAVRFCGLPASIQSYVLGDNQYGLKLPYGILVELARLAETYAVIAGEPLMEESMHRWVREAIMNRLNTTAFGKKVSAFLDELRQNRDGQMALFDLGETKAEHRKRVRGTVSVNLARELFKALEYFRVVNRAQSAGEFGDESVYGPYKTADEQARLSPASPINLTVQVCELALATMPEFARMARREKLGHFRRLTRMEPQLAEVVPMLEKLGQYERRLAA